jgi:hypothetical protein
VFGHGDEQASILVLLNKPLPRVIFFELGDTRNSADQGRFLLQPEGKAAPQDRQFPGNARAAISRSVEPLLSAIGWPPT